MSFAAIMFDMDGLLLDTERVCLESFLETQRQFSLPETPDTFLRCVGLRGDASRKIIEESLAGRVSLDAFDAAWDTRMSARLAQKIPMKNGAMALVRQLSAAGYPMGVATSTGTARAKAHLEDCGLLEYLDFVVGGDRVEKPKPDPEVYHMLAARLNTQAAHCVVFEDSEYGTRAGVASGAWTVQVPDLIPPTDALIALGHVIAPTLLDGAAEIGLLPKPSSQAHIVQDVQPE